MIGILRDLYRVGRYEKDDKNRGITVSLLKEYHCIEQITLIWSVAAASMFQIYNEETFLPAIANLQNNPSLYPKLNIWLYTNDKAKTEIQLKLPMIGEESGANIAVENGRPDYDTSLNTLLLNWDGENVASKARVSCSLVAVCGPEGMVSNVWDASNALQRNNGLKIDFHHEIFNW
jgi:hypothetical protein